MDQTGSISTRSFLYHSSSTENQGNIVASDQQFSVSLKKMTSDTWSHCLQMMSRCSPSHQNLYSNQSWHCRSDGTGFIGLKRCGDVSKCFVFCPQQVTNATILDYFSDWQWHFNSVPVEEKNNAGNGTNNAEKNLPQTRPITGGTRGVRLLIHKEWKPKPILIFLWARPHM